MRIGAVLESEQQLLERDKKTYATLREELPLLESRQQELNSELGNLQGMVETLRTREESLRLLLERGKKQLEEAKAESTEAISMAKVSRKEHAELRSRIQSARTQSRRDH